MDARSPLPPIAAGAASDAAVDALLQVMVPMARVAIDHGLQFRRMEELLKHAMIEAARDAAAEDAAATGSVSRLSVITGIHRQEIKRLLGVGRQPAPVDERTRVCELFIRWTTDPRWHDEAGRPRVLPRRFDRDDEPCFEKLARSVTRDVHPRTLLDELVRLELAEVDEREDTVALVRGLFVPLGRVADSLAFLGGNVGDHLAAARANVAATMRRRSASDPRPPFLEQSLQADELCAESALDGAKEATARWVEISRTMAQRLQALENDDRAAGRTPTHRVRIGMYCYTSPLDDAPRGIESAREEAGR